MMELNVHAWPYSLNEKFTTNLKSHLKKYHILKEYSYSLFRKEQETREDGDKEQGS